jgi:manganese/zinc/iron transport system substrate-binding protein
MLKMKTSWIFGVAVATIIVSCSETSQPDHERSKLKILATTGMIADLAKNIAGDSAEVMAMMGPGVDPHLYKATQGDLSKMRSADIILYNGLHLEGKMGEVLEKLARSKSVMAISDDLERDILLEDSVFQGNYDPHIWFNVAIWSQCIPNVLEALIEKDSANANYYTKNAERYKVRLDSLNSAVENKIGSIPEGKRILITAHDAFSYFGRAYGLDVRGLQGISTVSEFGLRDRVDLIDFIVERQIKAIFVETSVSEKNILSIVEGCKFKGHELKIGGNLYSDAMGPVDTREGTYIGMVEHNVNTIVEALK